MARHRHRRSTPAAAGALGAAALLAGALGLSSPTAGADPVDDILTATGQPGPHRVQGAYFTSPGVPAAADAARPGVLVGPSTPLLVGDALCTATVAGYDAEGNAVAVTAGHCGAPGATVASGDDPSRTPVGTVVRTGVQDNGVILLNGNAVVSRNYNNVTVDQLGGPSPAPLEQVCKTGIATGRSCGPVLGQVGTEIAAQICAGHGDSGAPVSVGGRLVGILSGGLAALPPCSHPLQGAAHSPALIPTWEAVAADLDAAGGVGAGFRLP
jgi:hypothetical protein